MFDLTGDVAIVTGAGRGVGAGIAQALAAQGATVVVNDVDGAAAATVAAIQERGGAAHASPFDVTDHGDAERAIRAIQSDLGRVDILVNNAGNAGTSQLALQQFKDTNPEAWAPAVDVNLYGVLNCCHAAIPGMTDRGYGRVITIASGAGLIGMRLGVAAYAAAKGGGISFMRHLVIESARTGVTANTIAIGIMSSDGAGGGSPRLLKGIPIGRFGRPDDVGPLCVYLASREAEWMTGQTLQINGGGTTT